jgi:hypothetical protein
MMGAVKFDEQIKSGKAKLKGNRDVYEQLKTTLAQFELGFELMPGTKGPDEPEDANPFEAENPHIPE